MPCPEVEKSYKGSLEMWKSINSLETVTVHKEAWRYWVNVERRGIQKEQFCVILSIFLRDRHGLIFPGVHDLFKNVSVTVNWNNSVS